MGDLSGGLPPLPGLPRRGATPDRGQSYRDQELERLRVQIATVQTENRRLRKLTTNGKQGKILHRANLDALQLVAWRESQLSITRRACLEYGMSERRWWWAVALLKLAGVLPMESFSADEFAVEEVVEIQARIARAAKRVEINGLSLLEFRLPKGRIKPRRRR